MVGCEMLRIAGLLLFTIALVVFGVLVGTYFYLSPEEEAERIPSAASIRAVTQGELIGYDTRHNSHAWLGIPYASPPVGELRWKSPREASPWEGRRDGLSYGDQCPQLPAIPGSDEGRGYVGSEDCLTLNVWAPAFDSNDVPAGSDALPVMFWIHGGGNTIGSGGSNLTQIYDGSLMAARKNVVVVTVNYRLGPMGWFYHESIRDTSDTREDASGNYGTLDLIAALKWVQDDIAAFGGDPENVTIFGESAGGYNVLSLMASPLAEGLFHKAIVQSGALEIETRENAEMPHTNPHGDEVMASRTMIADWLVQAGRADERNAAMDLQDTMSSQELAAWIRTLRPGELFGIFDGSFAGMIRMPLLIGDGHVLPALSPTEIFSDPSRYADVPLMIGTNREETALFMAFDPDYVEPLQGIPSRILNPTAYSRDVKYSTQLWRVRGADDIAQAMSLVSGDSVFVYRFDADDWRSLGPFDFKEVFGAAHAFELFFVFGYFPNPIKILIPDSNFEEVMALSNAMMSYWVQFARTGRPGAGTDGGQTEWVAWITDAPGNFIVLDTALDGGVRMEREILTEDSVRAAFLAENFGSPDEKCQSYRSVFFSWGFDQEEYQSLGCR